MPRKLDILQAVAPPRFPKFNPLLLTTMLLWGFNFVALKLIYLQMTPSAVSVVRFILMYAVLLAICRIMRLPLRYPKGETFRIFAMGFLAMGVYMIFFLEGMKDSTAAEGAIILGTSPIFTLLFAVIAKQERFSFGALMGALIAFVGVTLVVLAGARADQGKLIGNLLVLVSAALWAWSTVVSRPLVAQYHPLSILTLSMPGAILVLLPYGLSDTLAVDWLALNGTTWSMLIFMAIGAGAIGFALFYAGVKQIGAPGAMLYQYFVAPIAAISAYLVLHTALAPLQLVGLLVVILGVSLASHSRQKRQTHIHAATNKQAA